MRILPKAYLRVDPNLAFTHPDPGAFIRLLCHANAQPHRGRFKEWGLLENALGAEPAARLRDRGDLVEVDGRWYVSGWDEWQEGDLTVGERQRRVRQRRDSAVTHPLSDRDETVDLRKDVKTLRLKDVNERTTAGDQSRRSSPSNPLLGDRPEREREALRLVARLAEINGTDPAEEFADAAHYKGAERRKVNPAAMSDDRLLNTLMDLRANVRTAEAKIESKRLDAAKRERAERIQV